MRKPSPSPHTGLSGATHRGGTARSAGPTEGSTILKRLTAATAGLLLAAGLSARIIGTVKVERGATLSADRIRVNGNVQAENHRHVRLASSTVGGSIQLKQGGSASLGANRVSADIQLFTNRGTQTVSRNSVNGNLQCKENRPAPTGGGNVVQGNKEDQCARL
jgi:hypothetical protein